MRWWLILCVFGYATKAVPTIVDKALFHAKAVQHAATYAIAVSGIGGLVLLLSPFFLTFPTWHIAIYAIGSGIAFTFATLFLFSALQYSDASRVTPFIGAVISLTTVASAYISLDERLPLQEIFAFACLVLGSFLVTRGHVQGEGFKGKSIRQAVAAALMFTLSVILSKAAFDRMPGAFVSAIIWMRFGSLITGAVLLAFMPHVWKELKGTTSSAVPKRARFAFLGGQAGGAISGLLIYGAIALGTPSLVNAMVGMEYLFVIIYSLILIHYYPKLVAERFNKKNLPQLITAVSLIGTGLALLAF